ncbi:MAG: PilZ domain-containing protein [Nitrospiraceae bacterium]
MITRKHPRFAVQCPAVFRRESEGQGDIINLSIGGCCLQIPEGGADMKGIFTLHLQLPKQKHPLRVDSAHVRWKTATQFGLRFLFLETHELKRLDQYLGQLASRSSPAIAAIHSS